MERRERDECGFIHRLVSGSVRCGALRKHHSQYTGHEFTEPKQESVTRLWSFVKTEYSGKIDCGDFELRPHWNGGHDPEYLRTMMQDAVTEHNQHAALVEQRDRLLTTLLQIVNHANGAIMAGYKNASSYVVELSDIEGIAKDALATVEQGEGRE